MSFDFSTLVTDRTQADVNRVKQIAEKIKNGTASESEVAEFNSAVMKGAYNYTDLNRVTAAMESLKAKLEGYGYAVPGYQRIKVPHPEFKTSRLPEGYTELAWIESTGTQYVDTGFKPTYQTRVVADVSEVQYVGSTALFGQRDTASSGSARMYGVLITANQDEIRSDYYGTTRSAIVTDWKTKTTVEKNKNVFTGFGLSLTNTAVSSGSSTINMYIFAYNNAGSTTFYASYRLHSFQVYDNDVLVRDYVPCRNPSGEIGLYDLVTAAFFGNSGTGSFVAGAIPRELPDGYTQVEYIESNGTQRIDTGFIPNQDTRVVLSGVWLTQTANASLFGTRASSSSKMYTLTWTNSDSTFLSNYNTGGTRTVFSAGSSFVVDKNKNVTTINGTILTETYANFTCTVPLLLFATNNNGSPMHYCIARISVAKIYDNGILVRDFVPCRNASGVLGLYDMVNGAFYQNAGSGTFTAGEEITIPVTAAVPVVSVADETEYDPHTWYEFDWPTPETMTVYLLNVSAIRAVLSVTKVTPSVPVDMVELMAQEANNIEVILLEVYRQINIMATTFIPCGEALCGGDNL